LTTSEMTFVLRSNLSVELVR